MELLQQHGINNMYHVGFPSYEQALEILCKYAFRQSYPHNGFEELAFRVTVLCGKLPLGLRVVGSSLRGKQEEDWEDVINSLEIVLHRDIEDVFRVGYESLDEIYQSLFLHIAIFFIDQNGDLVKTMFAGSELDVKCDLKILAYRSLIELSTYGGFIVMHKLLQQMARQGTGAVSGISFDISGIDELSVGKKAFKMMPNLWFLNVYKSEKDGNDRMEIPEGMEFPRRLRLLRWEEYPSKCLPPSFHPEYLVKLEYLWRGTKKLTNLKAMYLSDSYYLKELPDLSTATNLEYLSLSDCESLIEIPSSCSNLHKLETLWMNNCRNLEVIPADLNLASLVFVDMMGCSKLRNLPIMSTRVKFLYISKAELEDVPASISLCSRLDYLSVRSCSGKLEGLIHLPASVTHLNLSNSDIERLPDCIKALHQLRRLDIAGSRRLTSLPELPSQLRRLDISGCRRLTSLPELPSSLVKLEAINCESLERVFCLFNTRLEILNLSGCRRLTSLPELPNSLYKLNAKHCESLETVFCPLDTRLQILVLFGCRRITSLPELPYSLEFLFANDYESLESVFCLFNTRLEILDISGCRRLTSLPELPYSLVELNANDCESLETVFCPFNIRGCKIVSFGNCFKLGKQARREIIRQSIIRQSIIVSKILSYSILPGRKVPVEFKHSHRKFPHHSSQCYSFSPFHLLCGLPRAFT